MPLWGVREKKKKKALVQSAEAVSAGSVSPKGRGPGKAGDRDKKRVNVAGGIDEKCVSGANKKEGRQR